MLKINKTIIILLAILVISLTGNLIAQEDEKLLPRFDFEVVSFPEQTFKNSETYVYVWVRNTHLQFVTRDSVYSARYQINIGIADQKGSSILTQDKTFNISERDYAVTIDPKAQHVHRFVFELPPEQYLIQIRLLDLNSNLSRSQERNKTIRAFEKNKLEVSDVLLVAESDTGSIRTDNVIPSFRVPVQEQVFVYAEVISPEQAKVLNIEANLRHRDGKDVFNFSQDVVAKNEITKIFLQINKESMVQGENQLYLKVTGAGQSKAIRKDMRFVAGIQAFEGLPVNDMVGPLLYVTDGDDWKKLITASDEQQDNVFQAFWNKRDPSPATQENELFNEFYQRVDLANRNFGYSRKDGWRTDRGRVFIVFGPPNRVERGTPSRYTQGNYEVWYYDDLREKFVFYDEYGFGDFRLVSGNIRPAY